MGRGWAEKPGQEVVLAIRLERSGFDAILREAVHSSYQDELYASREAWKSRASASNVRLRWDPETPRSRVCPVDDAAVARHLGVDPWRG